MSAKLQKIKTDSVKPNTMPLSRKVDTCKKLIHQYGVLVPPVVGALDDGTKTLIYGDCELRAMIELENDYADSLVVSLKDKTEGDKLALMLMEVRTSPDTIIQGRLINNLICSRHYTQIEIARLLNRSVSWVSKRLSLVTRLTPAVRDMVFQGMLSPLSAQEIARMPLDIQYDFSSKIIDGNIPKSKLEKLVSAYSRVDCPDNLKTLIIDDPARAIAMIPPPKKRQKRIASTGTIAAKPTDIPPDDAFGGIITACQTNMTTLVGLIFQVKPATILKHERALKQLNVDIDATLKIIGKNLGEIRFPQGKNYN